MDLEDFEKHIIPKIEAGRTVEAVRQIIKTGQYTEQDRRESLKETFKPITDELEKVDEGIDELKEELKDLKAVEGPPALPAIEGQLGLDSLEGPQQATIERKKKKKSKKKVEIDIRDAISDEALNAAKAYGFPEPMELLSRRDPNEFNYIASKVGNKLKSFGGRKRHAKSDDVIRKT